MKKPYKRASYKRPIQEPYKWVHTMMTQTFSADVQTFSEESSIVSVSTKLNCELTLENTYVWQIPQKMLRPPNSTRSKAPDSSVSRGTNSHWDFGLIWTCKERYEFLDSVGFGRVAWICHTHCMHSWQKIIPPTGESSQKWTEQSAWMTNWVVI